VIEVALFHDLNPFFMIQMQYQKGKTIFKPKDHIMKAFETDASTTYTRQNVIYLDSDNSLTSTCLIWSADQCHFDFSD
jgi:hypothetical protein